MKHDIEEILDNCLKEIKDGQKIDNCLKKYPEQAEELKSLLEASGKFSSFVMAEPSAKFLRSAKERILNHATQKIILLDKQPVVEKKAPAPLFWQRSQPRIWLLRAAVIGLVALLLGSGVISASANTLPGDFLYPVKRAFETAQVNLTFGAEARSRLYLSLAERRLNESGELLGDKDNKRARALLQEVGDNLKLARNSSAGLKDRQELLRKLITLSERQQAILWKVYEKVPERTKEAIGQAIEKSQQGHEQAVQELQKMRGGQNTEVAPGSEKETPGKGKSSKGQEEKSDSEKEPASQGQGR